MKKSLLAFFAIALATVTLASCSFGNKAHKFDGRTYEDEDGELTVTDKDYKIIGDYTVDGDKITIVMKSYGVKGAMVSLDDAWKETEEMYKSLNLPSEELSKYKKEFYKEFTMTYTFKEKGKTVTITDEDGEDYVLTRVKK